jgi:hypothetical protein
MQAGDPSFDGRQPLFDSAHPIAQPIETETP